MGYRNSAYDEDWHVEDDAFRAQFEWDGHGWTFRRFERARPVRVTAEEMDDCISYFEGWRRRLKYAAIALAIAVGAAWIFADFQAIQWADDSAAPGLGLVTMAALGWIGDRWAWVRATKRFLHRVPIGSGQTWLERRQALAVDRNWRDLLVSPLLFGGIAFLIFQLDKSHLYELVMAGVAGLAVLFDLGLKIRSRFL